MIRRTYPCSVAWTPAGVRPFLVRIGAPSEELEFEPRTALVTCTAHLKENGTELIACSGSFALIEELHDELLEGELLLIDPKKPSCFRLLIPAATHNALLITEQCDQLCVMCSQPPKSRDDSWLYWMCRDALLAAPPSMRITLTGGEPTLHKERLFEILDEATRLRPDLKIHILSNGQHLSQDDRETLVRIHRNQSVSWGIPIYSSVPVEHDTIVAKVGAFETLMDSLFILGSTGSIIEIRTVVLAQNFHELPFLAKFLGKNLSFMSYWALMALEPTGFARAFKTESFIDHTQFVAPLAHSVDIAASYGIDVRLFNFPLCTLPHELRRNCVKSISDWKQKYESFCNECAIKDACGGFFEWYDVGWSYKFMGPVQIASKDSRRAR